MRIDVESVADFYQYYGRTYIKGRNREVYWCGDRERNRYDNKITFSVSEGNNWKKEVIDFDNLKESIFFGLPTLGTYAINNELVWLCYTPYRHGRRGFDTNRILVYSFNNYDISKAGLPKFEIESFATFNKNPERIKQIMFPTYTPFKDAWSGIGETSLAFALSKDFGMFLSSQRSEVLLTYHNNIVGIVEDGKPVIEDDAAQCVWRNTMVCV